MFITRLLVLDFPACFRYYRDVLQLEPHWGDENGPYASFDRGQTGQPLLAIFQRQLMAEVVGTSALPLDLPAQDRFVLTLSVDSVDAEVRRIRQLGVEVQGPVDFPDWGYRGAFLRDPDGVLIELSSELPAERWSEGLRQANEKWQKG